MQRHSFIEMTKLSNVEGRISYITSEKKQEYLYATYDTEDSSFWGELAKCCQAEFKKNGTNGKCIGEMSLDSAIQFMSERGYTSKTVQIKVSELPEEISIRARIARSRQRADEHNRNRQQRNRDRSSRGAR